MFYIFNAFINSFKGKTSSSLSLMTIQAHASVEKKLVKKALREKEYLFENIVKI